MSISIGEQKSLKIEVGDFVDESKELCYIDIWIAGEKITLTDNVAFIEAIKSTVEDDFYSEKNLSRFEKYFTDKNIPEIHKFIVSTRDSKSSNYDIENDELFRVHQVFDWGPNTDDVLCFFIIFESNAYITFEFVDSSLNERNVFFTRIDVAFYKQILQRFIHVMNKMMKS